LSYNIVPCLLFMTVPRNLPRTSPLLCILWHPEGAFHYNARFVITLISAGSQNERYNEVAVYFVWPPK